MNEPQPTRLPGLGMMIVIRLVGVIFAVAGVLVIINGGQTTTLSCWHAGGDRADCVIERHWMNVVSLGEDTVPAVSGAWVSSSRSDSKTLYRIELTTDQGDVHLTSYQSDSLYQEEADAARISDFVQAGEGTLEIIKEGARLGIVFGAFAVLLGLGLIAAKLKP